MSSDFLWDDDYVDWALAVCAQTDPEAFFPEKGGSSRDAKRICASCDIQQDCLEYALARDIRFGIWGGTTELQRRSMRRQRRATPRTEVTP